MTQSTYTTYTPQNPTDDEITIDLAELFSVILGKIHLVILAGILMALLAFVGTKLLITPMYASTTKIYVLARQDASTAATYSELQAGTQLTKDYMELVKSRPVLEKVIAVQNLELEPEELADMITVETPTDTRVLRITVKHEDPVMAKAIADSIREAVSIQITEIMDADAVNTVEEGNLPTKPVSPSLKRNLAVGGMLGILLALAVIVLVYMLDDTIKSPEDVDHYLGLNVLASIPIQEGTAKTKKKKTAKKSSKSRKRTH